MKQLGISFESLVLLFFNASSRGKSMTAPLPRSLYMGRKAVYRQGWEVIFIPVHEGYRKSSINPPPGGGGAYLFQTHLKGGGLIGNGGLFNLEKVMVSVLHKELQYNTICKKLKYKVGDHAAEDHNEI